MPVTKEQEKVLTETIRKWHLTLCHDLCLPVIEVEISLRPENTPYGGRAAGRYDNDKRKVILYLIEQCTERDYLETLAHELRHCWQDYYRVAPTERDCDFYATDFLRRISRPTGGSYHGPIHGESYQCKDCDAWISTRLRCKVCDHKFEERQQAQRRECENQRWRLRREYEERLQEERRRKKERLFNAIKLPVKVIRRGLTALREAIFSLPQVGSMLLRWQSQRQFSRFANWSHAVDHHPDNGKVGWWLVDGQYYVQASAAGEAVIKIASRLDTTCPSITYIGEQPPR